MRYLQSHIGAIIRGITAGYGLREERRERRIEMIIRGQPRPWDGRVTREIAELRRSASRSWRWIDWLDRIWQFQAVRAVLSVVATAASVLALTIYAPLRAIPIKAIRERAELASLDAQLVSAFGDLPVLLDDPVQAAIVRERLAERDPLGPRSRVRRGRADRPLRRGDRQLRHAPRRRLPRPAGRPSSSPSARASRLAGGWSRPTGPFVAGNPIRGDLGAARPGLRWVDFWASYDPAPAGPLVAVDDCPLVAVETVDAAAPASPIQVESRPVTNLMHMGADHDGYWRNDEGFLVPLIRHIDDPRGDGSALALLRIAAGPGGPDRTSASPASDCCSAGAGWSFACGRCGGDRWRCSRA